MTKYQGCKWLGCPPQASDAGIPRDLASQLDPDVDWVAIRVAPFELIEISKDDMNVKRIAIPNS